MVVYPGVYLCASFRMPSPATIIIFWLNGSKANSLHNEVSCQIGLLIFSEVHVLCPSFFKSQVPQSVQRAVVLIVQNWLLIQTIGIASYCSICPIDVLLIRFICGYM